MRQGKYNVMLVSPDGNFIPLFYWKEERMRKGKYHLWNFVFDICMIAITGGLWLIWIFVREMRNR